jgi:hypothetical protein
VECAPDDSRRVNQRQIRTRRAAVVRSASIQQCFYKPSQSIRFQLNLGEELLSGFVIPFDIGATQAADEPLDVAQWQPQVMCGSGQDLIGGRPTRHTSYRAPRLCVVN